VEQQRRLLHGDITRVVLGAFYAVHNELGFGFLEAVYRNAIAVMLSRAGVPVQREVPFPVVFHGVEVGFYRADLIVTDSVLVEVKTGRDIAPEHVVQLRNCLRASGIEVGLLLHFGRRATFRRLVMTTDRSLHSVSRREFE
jgi:GxxExxY protein